MPGEVKGAPSDLGRLGAAFRTRIGRIGQLANNMSLLRGESKP